MVKKNDSTEHKQKLSLEKFNYRGYGKNVSDDRIFVTMFLHALNETHQRKRSEGKKNMKQQRKKKRIKCIIPMLNPIVKRHSDGASHSESVKINTLQHIVSVWATQLIITFVLISIRTLLLSLYLSSLCVLWKNAFMRAIPPNWNAIKEQIWKIPRQNGHEHKRWRARCDKLRKFYFDRYSIKLYSLLAWHRFYSFSYFLSMNSTRKLSIKCHNWQSP